MVGETAIPGGGYRRSRLCARRHGGLHGCIGLMTMLSEAQERRGLYVICCLISTLSTPKRNGKSAPITWWFTISPNTPITGTLSPANTTGPTNVLGTAPGNVK